MNAFIRKEVRLQGPTFAIGAVATLLLWLSPNNPSAAYANSNVWWAQLSLSLSLLSAPIIGLMLALNSFGREFSGGTFSSLLAQPVPRSRVWWTKVAILASALAILLVLWVGSFKLHFREVLARPDAGDIPLAMTAILFTVVVFSGGLWTVLFFRQVAAAFWFTLLIPGFLLAMVNHKFSDDTLADLPQPKLRLAIAIALSLYSVAGFLFARWLFLRAQDAHWSGGTIALPWTRQPALRLFSQRDHRRWRPRAALWFKEFGLHRSQLVVAGVLAGLHLAVVIARYLNHGFKSSPTTEFLAEHFWALWVCLPWLVGCAAVAEERKLGTLEAHLCQPARRRTQFAIKLASTMLIAVLLGAVMPLLLERREILPDMHINKPGNFAFATPGGEIITLAGLFWWFDWSLPFLTLTAIAVATASMSFYVSTFSRNTLQAIAPATLAILAFYIWWFAAPRLDDNPIWHGWLIHYVGVPVLLPALLGLAYWNFKQICAGWPLWRRNLIVLGGAFAFMLLATGLIYHRTWEWLTPMEPKHGPAFLKPGGRNTLSSAGLGFQVRLPDGHIWINRTPPFAFIEPSQLPGVEPWLEQRRRGEIIEDTNWLAFAANYHEMLGIKTDGSLWITETPLTWTNNWWRQPLPGPARFVRIGQDNDWSGMAINGPLAYLLKTNGTLWRLGTNPPIVGKRWLPLRDALPTQLGTNTDWARIFIARGAMIFQKVDGTSWSSMIHFATEKEQIIMIHLDSQMNLFRASAFDAHRGELPIETHWEHGNFFVSVLDDGQFVLSAAREQSRAQNPPTYALVPKRIPLSRETNWISATAYPRGGVLTLKSDGTIWKWNFPRDPVKHPESASASRVGKHSDWIALGDCNGLPVTLAADGSFWTWQFPANIRKEPKLFPPEIAPTRKPFHIGQIPRPGTGGK